MAKSKSERAAEAAWTGPKVLDFDQAGIDQWLSGVYYVQFRIGAFWITLIQRDDGSITGWANLYPHAEFGHCHVVRQYAVNFDRKAALDDLLSITLEEVNRIKDTIESARSVLLK